MGRTTGFVALYCAGKKEKPLKFDADTDVQDILEQAISVYGPGHITDIQGYRVTPDSDLASGLYLYKLDAEGTGVHLGIEQEYLARLAKLPDPRTFAKCWPEFQLPGDTIGSIADYEREGPLFNCYRPMSAQGIPAAFAHPAFGRFLDLKHSAPLRTEACKAVLDLVPILSDSYSDKARNQEALGRLSSDVYEQLEEADGVEIKMALVQDVLYYFFYKARNNRNNLSTLEQFQEHRMSAYLSQEGIEQPGRVATVRCTGRGGPNDFGRPSEIPVLIVEGTGDVGEGGGGNAVMQLCASYAHWLLANNASLLVAETVVPVIGIEVSGHGLRFHALFLTDKVCCEPLTEHVHFAGLLMSQPSYMEYLARIFDSLATVLDELCIELRPYADFLLSLSTSAIPPRKQQLNEGIPWMLRDERYGFKRLMENKYVHLCTPVDSAASAGKFVAKVVTTPYPVQLHEELSALGLAPRLTEAVRHCPGGVTVIRMEYMDPADGWVSLRNFTGDWDALEALAEAALAQLQSCLDSQAVHGDLTADNVLVRVAAPEPGATGTSSFPQQLMFIDLSWGGVAGTACYPPFLNPRVPRAIENADGRPIEQWHDGHQLREMISRHSRRPPRMSQPTVSGRPRWLHTRSLAHPAGSGRPSWHRTRALALALPVGPCWPRMHHIWPLALY